MAAEDPADGYLFDLYRRYIGEPDDRTDIYVGFGLFLGGIGLAVIALVVFLWGTTYDHGSSEYFNWLRPAYALGMVSLPALMLGIVVLLPSERRMRYISAGSLALTAAAAVGFVLAYPSNWLYNDDYSILIVGTYAVGLAGVTASTGAALIAHYLDMARAVEHAAADEDEDEDEGPAYTDAEIQSDIDAAMEGVELSWGGVEKSENKRLTFSDHDFDSENLDTNMATKTTRSTGVDAQVAGLKGLKGGEKKTAVSESTVDDQTQKLKALREQRQKEQAATAEASGNDGGVRNPLSGVLERLRALVKRN
ncbi:permease [Natrialbaceae archaeon A-CW1-1]